MKSIKLSFVFLLAAIFLSSCSNFLGGSKIKQEIEDAINDAKTPVVSITLHAEEGNIEPSGKQTVKCGQPLTVVANNDDKQMAFIGWKCNGVLLDPESAEYKVSGLAEIITVEDWTSKKTQVTVIKEGKELELSPFYKTRPQIILASPTYPVNVEEFIRVDFSTEIDKSSFTYSKEERAEILKNYKENPYLYPFYSGRFICWVDSKSDIFDIGLQNPQWETFEPVYETDSEEVYGFFLYDKESPQKTRIIYKNIEVYAYNETQNGSLSMGDISRYFTCPYMLGEKTLVIPTSINNPPEKNSTIRVEIKKFFDTEGIEFADDSYKWLYYTNSEAPRSEGDITPPVIVDYNFPELDSAESEKIKSITLTSGETAYQFKEIILSVSMTDSESGIDKATVSFESIYDAEGNAVTPETLGSYNVNLYKDLHGYFADAKEDFLCPKAAGFYKLILNVTDRKGNSTTEVLKFNNADLLVYTDVSSPVIDFKINEDEVPFSSKIKADVSALNGSYYSFFPLTASTKVSFDVYDETEIKNVKMHLTKLYSLDESKTPVYAAANTSLTKTISGEIKADKYSFSGILPFDYSALGNGIYQISIETADILGNTDIINTYSLLCKGLKDYYDAQAAAYENDTTGPAVTYGTMKKSDGTELPSTLFVNIGNVTIGNNSTYNSLLLSDSKLVITGTINDDGSGPEKIELYLARYFKENGADGYEMTISYSSGITEDELNAAVKVSPNPSVSVTQNGTFELTFDLSGLEDGIYIPVGLQGFDRKGNASAEVVINEIDPSNLLTAEMKAFILNNH